MGEGSMGTGVHGDGSMGMEVWEWKHENGSVGM